MIYRRRTFATKFEVTFRHRCNVLIRPSVYDGSCLSRGKHRRAVPRITGNNTGTFICDASLPFPDASKQLLKSTRGIDRQSRSSGLKFSTRLHGNVYISQTYNLISLLFDCGYLWTIFEWICSPHIKHVPCPRLRHSMPNLKHWDPRRIGRRTPRCKTEIAIGGGTSGRVDGTA